MAASYADADGRCVASPARAEQPRLQILKQALAQGGAKCLARNGPDGFVMRRREGFHRGDI